MKEIIFLGSYYAEIKDQEIDFFNEIKPLILDRKDNIIEEKVENFLKSKGINVEDLYFHSGANHLEWKKRSEITKKYEDFFVIERHY